MRRAWLAVLAALLVLTPPQVLPQKPAAAADPIVDRIQELLQDLSQITGWRVKRQVPYEMIGRDELEEFLDTRIEQEIDPEEIRIDEILLEKFGFVPADFDLRQSIVELYSEQAAALYDYREKKLFLLESDDVLMQETVLAHELAHALADQHYRLEKFTNAKSANDDEALARLAVVEGQATWLMSEVSLRRLGQSLSSSPELVDLMSKMIGATQGEFPVFDEAPLYLRESLIFPYLNGLLFQQAAIAKWGEKGFSEVFRHPPVSTQEVLHPDRYFARRKTEDPKLPRLKGQGGYRKLAEGTLGEFDYAVLLSDYAGEEAANEIAPNWTAGRYRLLERKRDGRLVLVHVSRWTDEETAKSFFENYRKILDGKWSNAEFSQMSTDSISGEGDDGFFRVDLRGRDVYCIEGLERPDDMQDLR